MKLPSKEDLGFIGIVVAIVLIFFYIILGFSGMMSALGIILLFIVPTYLILDNFDLRQDEKIVFSFFIGVGVFPSIVYWLGLFISLKIAIFISFIVLVAIGFLVGKFLKRKNQ